MNFSVFSRNATRLELLLFDGADDPRPARVVPLDPAANPTHFHWHAFVPGLRPGQIYAYRAHGPIAPEQGLRFDGAKVLLDPYGRAVAVPPRRGYSREAASRPGDSAAVALKSVVVDPGGYDWEGDAPLRRPFARTVIYEMHVRGFTRHPNSGVSPDRRGTYAGLIEKIPYLRDLGVTAVELLPVFQYDPQDCPPGLVNYWGYSPVSFFAPHVGYSSRQHDPLGPLDEFRDMVKALHRAGIEVMLDVVYNHTAEGDRDGPTLRFRGLTNDAYYMLESGKSSYADYTGTGKTPNANHPLVRRPLIDPLRYCVEEMHVDGFRFDLASILSRDEAGRPLANPPVPWDIETDPALAGIPAHAGVHGRGAGRDVAVPRGPERLHGRRWRSSCHPRPCPAARAPGGGRSIRPARARTTSWSGPRRRRWRARPTRSSRARWRCSRRAAPERRGRTGAAVGADIQGDRLDSVHRR